MSTKNIPLAPAPAGSTFAADPESLAGRDICSILDLNANDVRAILDMAHAVKAHPKEYRHALDGKQLVMFFEKDSLRTRLTFEAGMHTLGGSAIFIDQKGSRLGERETLADVAHNLERWVDVIVLRTFAHDTITGIAEPARIPVINALSDVEHPCQALTDIFTLEEHFGDLRGLNVSFIGDGNNVAHSLLLACVMMGANITVATPKGYEPRQRFLDAAQQIAANSPLGGSFRCTHDPIAAATGADAIYTDAWTSMGQEQETARRQKIFRPYQINAQMMEHAAPHAVFMHCLPAHRNEEVTDEVIDGAGSIVFDQAENRMHVQKALLLLLLGAGTPPAKSPHRAPRV
jgi:ornithine carbamoyltransferase